LKLVSGDFQGNETNTIKSGKLFHVLSFSLVKKELSLFNSQFCNSVMSLKHTGYFYTSLLFFMFEWARHFREISCSIEN